jgi:hypothetical protein
MLHFVNEDREDVWLRARDVAMIDLPLAAAAPAYGRAIREGDDEDDAEEPEVCIPTENTEP